MDVYQNLEASLSVISWKEIVGFLVIIASTIFAAGKLCKAGIIKKSQALSVLIFVWYFLLIFFYTVLTRTPGSRKYELRFLWSYYEIFSGNRYILQEVLLNILLLVLVGLLVPVMFSKPLRWNQGLAFGLASSAIIELTQLITCRGLFEFDDILHNGIGCMGGCILCSQIMRKWGVVQRNDSANNESR